jgi:anaerobic selenocysteine-containing dehydrogenase
VRFAEGGFPTASGRCELFADPAPACSPPAANGHPLVMISAKTGLHFLNTNYTNLPRHRRAAGEPMVDIAAADAAVRGIADGDRVRVHNERGELLLTARVGEGVRPGVVSVAHGWWRSLSGGSANDLTSDGLADLGGGGDFFGTRVEVTRAVSPGSWPPGAGGPSPSRAR